MTSSEADDYKASFVTAMGELLGEQVHALWLEVTWLYIKWAEFVEIFGDRERISLLNKAAPSFFVIIEQAFWQDILLNLTRLTDPPRSAGKENLTIVNLPNLISDVKLSARV